MYAVEFHFGGFSHLASPQMQRHWQDHHSGVHDLWLVEAAIEVVFWVPGIYWVKIMGE